MVCTSVLVVLHLESTRHKLPSGPNLRSGSTMGQPEVHGERSIQTDGLRVPCKLLQVRRLRHRASRRPARTCISEPETRTRKSVPDMVDHLPWAHRAALCLELLR